MEYTGTIFLIDDDAVVNYLHAKTLAKAGIVNTKAFERATDALELFKQQPPDNAGTKNIIFLDLNMPGMDGWEFLDEFVKLPASVTGNYTVIIISSSIDPKDIGRSKEYNIPAFISKPLTTDKLMGLLAKLDG